MPTKTKPYNLQRATLLKLQEKSNNPLIPLRIEYSEKSKLLSNYINKLVHVNRIFPRHLPTQASGRWSTIDPPITNWPRACINPECQDKFKEANSTFSLYVEHEWDEECFSLRDILTCNPDEVLVSWDHDNIEGKIHDLIVNDTTAIEAHRQMYDLHTITCCDIFDYEYPSDLRNPHTSIADVAWRAKYKWQGKDTTQRVLSKNFNHGSKYSPTYAFVNEIKNIEKYGVTKKHLVDLAKAYIESKGASWKRKLAIMEHIRKTRISRTLYGFRRVFFDSSVKTGNEGFSHMISGTVTEFNNETLILFEELLGDAVTVLHNAHDGDKISIKKDFVPSKDELKQIIERSVTYQERSLIMTAGIKVYGV